MSSMATALVLTVEANGGQFLIEGEELVIRPGDAAMPVLEELRAHKAAIVAFLQHRSDVSAGREQEGLGPWLAERCAFFDRVFSGVGALPS